MPHYRIVLVEKEVISCMETEQHLNVQEESLYYHYEHGNMTVALVKADTNEKALELTRGLIATNQA
jgi:hypothetical protein